MVPTRIAARQHFLNFFPLPQGHGSFRPMPLKGFSTCWLRAVSASACRRQRSWSSRYCSLKQYHPDNSEILLEMFEPKDVGVDEAAVEPFLDQDFQVAHAEHRNGALQPTQT
jgi:hypothetical protein